jgi:glycosyltransferase involved in cell wall biosynthesis
MIAKNEEDNIERSLLSVKPVVDEMIVVDTGSTDRTKDIARSLGAKVYDFPWTDSFSDARNFSLSKASGKWLLVLDADEAISSLDYERLKELVIPSIEKGARGQGFKDSREDLKTHSAPGTLELLNPAVVAAYSFVTRTYVAQLNTANWVGNDGQYINEEAGTGWFPGEKVRLFPNDDRFRFEFPLHERIEPSLIKAGIEIRESNIPIHHYGNFVKKEKAASKSELYYQLGKRKLAEYGEQNVMAFYELALLGAEAGKYEETLGYLNRVIALKPDFSRAHQSMGNAYYNLGRYGDALSSYKRAIQLDPSSRDAALMCATCEIFTGNAETSVSLLEEFLRNNPSYPQAMLLLAEAYFCMGVKEKGIECTQKLRDVHFNIEDMFVQFARLLVSAGRCDYAIALLKSAFEPSDMTSEIRDLLDYCYRLKENPSTSSG